MTRHQKIDVVEATVLTNSPSYADQVRELDQLHADMRNETVAWIRDLPFFAEVNKIAFYGLAFFCGTVVLTAIAVGLGA